MAQTLSLARVTGDALDAALLALLPAEPELPYANFLPVARREGAAVELHRRRWTAAGAICTSVAYADGKPLAAVRAVPREFESAHFGMQMAQLGLPIAVRDHELRPAALRAAYTDALAAVREAGYVHIAARASTRDRAATWVLQELGFFHLDTQVSWMCPLTGTPHDEALPADLELEVYEGKSIASIDRRDWQRLADWAGEAFDRGPFVFDLGVPYDRAKAIYRVWTERMMAGEWSDAVLLVRRDKEAVAFISMLILPDVSDAADTVVCGRGLGATLPEYRGLFTTIQREMIAKRPLGASFMENETQVATIGSINVYAKLGFRYLRSTSTFHRAPGVSNGAR